MRSIGKCLAVLLLAALYTTTYAQDTTLNIDPVVVDNGYIPKLAPAVKENTPPVAEQPEAPRPTLSYTLTPIQFRTVSRLDIPQALQMDKNYIPDLKNNHIKLGFGNYASPLAEIYLHSKRTEYGVYGLSFRHLSASGPNDAKFSDNNGLLFGQRFFKRGTLSAAVNYDRNAVRYFGFNDTMPRPSDDSLKQVLTTAGVKGGWESREWGRNKMKFGVFAEYYNLTDKWGVKENDVLVKGNFKTLIKKDNVLKISLAQNLSAYEDSSVKLTRNYTYITPTYTMNEKGVKLTLGFNSTIYKDTGDVIVYFFPILEGEVPIEKDNLFFMAGVKGDLRKNSFKTFTTENPFMGNRNIMDNTINRVEFYGGIRGKASAKFGFLGRVFYNSYNNLAVYIADSTVLRRFKPVYIDAKVVRLNAELSFQYSEKVRFNVTGNFYRYNIADSAQQPWQLPTAEIKLNSTYNIGDKLLISADIFFMNQRKATTEYSSQPATTLKGFTDFNIGLEYRYRKTLSLFLRANNISSVRYQRWYNYPVLGINVLGGITFSL